MKKHAAIDTEFNNLQNRFRGLVSGFKSRKFEKGRDMQQPPAKFRQALRELFLDARSTLHLYQFDEILAWIDLQMQNRLVDIANQSIGFDELSGVYVRAPIVSLERELIWLTARFKTNTVKLNTFRSGAEEVEFLVFSGDTETAIEDLKLIEQAFGSTLWSVEKSMGSGFAFGDLNGIVLPWPANPAYILPMQSTM